MTGTISGDRRSLRAPVYLDVRCDLAAGPRVKGKIVNLGAEGICIKTSNPVVVRENLDMEFLLPDTLSSVQLEGRVVWVRFQHEGMAEKKSSKFVAGIEFVGLKEPYISLIRQYTLRFLYDETFVQSQGIDRVLDDISHLPEKERRIAVEILTRKGLMPQD